MSDRGDEKQLSPTTAMLAYAAYAMHAAAVVLAARRGVRFFPAVERAAKVAGIVLVATGSAMYAAGPRGFAPSSSSPASSPAVSSRAAHTVTAETPRTSGGL